MASSPVNIVNVKSMISIFENQTVSVNDEPSRLRKAKSLGNLSTYSSKNTTNNNNNIFFVKTSEPTYSDKNYELVQIGQQVQHLKRTLNNYKTYSKENHIYYQNQIFFLLADLVNVETRNNSEIIDMKSELMEEAKRLNKILNSRLPSEDTKVQHHANFSATNVTKHVKEEAKVPHRTEKREEMPEMENYKEIKFDSNNIEENAQVPSVKNLKKLFERNSSVNEVPDRNSNKITRKFKTFNGTSDAKYVPYSERFKSKESDLNKEEEIPVRNDFYEKSSKFDNDDAEKAEDKEDEMRRDLSPDYLSGEESDDSSTVSGGNSDERIEKDEGSS